MEYVLFLIISFILVYLTYELFVIRKEVALKKMKNSKDVVLLSRLSGLDISKINLKKLVRTLALTNATIISVTCTIVLILNKFITNFYIWVLVSCLIGIIILIPIIIVCYKFIGKRFKKEGR